MRILIAEDDHISRRLLEATLQKKGYDVKVTSDGNEAWQELRKKSAPQVAVLDWMMPGLDGINVIKKVRKKRGSPYIYVILLTAKGRKEDIAAGLEAGADDYVTKPFDSKELHARVKVGLRMVDLHNRLEDYVKRLKELDQLKTDFLSTVSHELRTPIAVMRGGVSLCLDGVAGEVTEMQRDILTDTLENVDRLNRLVTDLLDVTKIEAGKVQLRRSTVDLCEIVNKIYKEYMRQAEEKGISLTVELPETPVYTFVDSDKVVQIFNNLVSNAVRYTKKGGNITLAEKEKKEFVECRVSDTGVGIAKENIPRLFLKFEQFGRVEGSEYKGTGLGLVIVKGMVEMHGGRIWVESELGKGTTFRFTLKKEPLPRILVVDDAHDIVELIKKQLGEKKFQYIEANDGRQAVKIAKKENPSLIVLDLMMPELDGYEVIKELNRDKKTKSIPFLILSGYAVDEQRLKRINGHSHISILEKPFDRRRLISNVQEMLQYENA